MSEIEKDFFSLINNNDLLGILSLGNIGIEKESLRVTKTSIAQSPHFKSLGSALCNKYITTDFSEALLELITPPLTNNKDAISFLDDLHHFIHKNIKEELLWPYSMPPFFQDNSHIPIAYYGSSNSAKFKMTYRKGLSHRYGRGMQAIAGIHFNYSFSEKFWPLYFSNSTIKDNISNRNDIYFRTLRNIHRFNWLILYLFGSSPIVSENFKKETSNTSIKYKDCYFFPESTSMRMSDMGYQNYYQKDLLVSLNSLSEYLDDLKSATRTISKNFFLPRKFIDGLETQLNNNLLQIEDEYYANSRPKTSDDSEQRLIKKLRDNGVNYIELRSLDLDPMENTGINLETIYFLEAFVIYCTLKSSRFIGNSEYEECKRNELLVSHSGRKKDLSLSKNGENILLKDWAFIILEEMKPILELLGCPSNNLDSYYSMITNEEQTKSAIFLNNFLDSNLTFHEYISSLAINNKKEYVSRAKQMNNIWDLIQGEINNSSRQQNAIEAEDQQNFQTYLSNYFQS